MTINDLVDRLQAFLEQVLAELRLEASDGGAHRAPVLVAGWLPPSTGKSICRPCWPRSW